MVSTPLALDSVTVPPSASWKTPGPCVVGVTLTIRVVDELEPPVVATRVVVGREVLDDDDDVQTVWGNYDISDEIMERLG